VGSRLTKSCQPPAAFNLPSLVARNRSYNDFSTASIMLHACYTFFYLSCTLSFGRMPLKVISGRSAGRLLRGLPPRTRRAARSDDPAGAQSQLQRRAAGARSRRNPGAYLAPEAQAASCARIGFFGKPKCRCGRAPRPPPCEACARSLRRPCLQRAAPAKVGVALFVRKCANGPIDPRVVRR
jgi:hypothetical protein